MLHFLADENGQRLNTGSSENYVIAVIDFSIVLDLIKSGDTIPLQPANG